MAETIKLEMTQEEATQLKDVLDEFLRKTDVIFEQMNKDQSEIEQYRTETRAIIDRLERKAA